MITKEHREEIIAKLISEYRSELDSLKDAELLFHLEANKNMQAMTDKQWQELMER